METLTELVNLIASNGAKTVIIAVSIGLILWNYKAIVNWFITTVQASAIVKAHKETIKKLERNILELRTEYEAQISELRMQIEKQNELILAQTRSIAQLEEKYKGAAEVARKYFNRSKYDDEA